LDFLAEITAMKFDELLRKNMPNKNTATDKHIHQFLSDHAEREKLAGEIMMLAEQVAEKKPEVLDELVSSIIPADWAATKPN